MNFSDNVTANSSDAEENPTTTTRYAVLMTIWTTIGAFVVILNVGVLVVLLTDKVLRKNTYCLVVLSLSLSDLVVGFCTIIKLVVSEVDVLRGWVPCFTSMLLYIISGSVSNLQIVYICGSRILAMKMPHKFKNFFTLRICVFAVIFMWIISLIEFGITGILWIGDHKRMEMVCVLGTAFIKNEMFILYTINNLFGYGLIFMSFGYLVHLLRLKKSTRIASQQTSTMNVDGVSGLGSGAIQAKSIPSASGMASSTGNDREQVRAVRSVETEAIRSLAIVVALVTILTVPGSVAVLAEKTMDGDQLPQGVQPYLLVLATCNSLVNPLVYAFTMSIFRAALKRKLKCWKRSR